MRSTQIRPWRVVAQELSGETDPARVSELAAELSRALNEQTVLASSPAQDRRIPPESKRKQ